MSLSEAAAFLQADVGDVRALAAEHGMLKRRVGVPRPYGVRLDRQTTPEAVHQMYWGAGQSLAQIARRLGVSEAALSRWMARKGVATRGLSKARRVGMLKGRVLAGRRGRGKMVG